MKKKILTCLVMLVCMLTLAVTASAANISSEADLLALMNATSEADLAKDYVLTKDLDMSDTTGQSPIGSETLPFTGTFDGNGHTIEGLTISASARCAGLFAVAQGTKTDPAIIKNLTVDGTITSTKGAVGGLVGSTGTQKDTYLEIRNCVNKCTVKSSDVYAGGILGWVQCKTSANSAVSGNNVTIENCINNGALSSKKHTGGILGRIENSNVSSATTGTAVIKNCLNTGAISNTGGDGAGGILAVALVYHVNVTVDNCYNAGKVTGQQRVGGILGIGYCHTGKTITVKNSVNAGAVTSTNADGYTGGVVGGMGAATAATIGTMQIENNCNLGDVSMTNTSAPVALSGHILGGYFYVNTKPTAANVNKVKAQVTLTGNSYDPSATMETGCNTFGGHGCLYTLSGSALSCKICSTTISSLTTTTINDETWIQIDSADDLLLLMENSKAGNADALSYNYILTANIDLTNEAGQYPIGQPTHNASSAVPAMFTGKFDGNNKTISGLDLTGCVGGYGLFGSVGGGTTGGGEVAVIKNVTVSGKVTSTFTNSFTGGVVGIVYGSVDIDNCVNNCTVSGVSRVGGVVGAVVYNVTALDDYTYTANIKNCVNNGAVSASTLGESRLGGIVGQISMGGRTGCVGTIENCTNNGTVTAEGSYVGGIVSRLEPNASKVSAINCVNSASATVTGKNYVGGIAGITYYSANTTGKGTVSRCINYASVTADGLLGGIVGYAYAGFSATYVQDCLNVGSITGKYRVGGINGYTHTYRKANTTYASTPLNVYVENCVNIGDVTATGNNGTAEAAGISAIANVASISGCINAGTITGTGKYIAGISANAVTTSFEDCLSMGTTVSNTEGADGVYAIVGNKQSGCSYAGCNYMTGTLAAESAFYASEATAAEAKELLALWCIYHGPKSDTDITKSTHTFGDDNKCIVCGAEPHANHEGSAKYVENEEVRIDATCKADGTKFLFCEKCYVTKTETIPKAHLFEWNLTDLDFGCRTCDDDFEQNVSVEEAKNLTTIYVSDDGVAGNNGTDASHPLDSFATAMDVAAALGNAYGHEMTIKLVGNVTLARRQYSAVNTHALSFEETKHDYPITITSADVNNKGTLRFSDDAYYYFLYGDTTFKDMQFGALDRVGTKSGDSDASNIFARGFSLTMDTGLEMLSNSQDISVPKINAGVDGLGATVSIPDVKLYVFGGFQATGYYDGEAGKNNTAARTADSNLTILSGKYWTIAGANRGGGLNTYSEKTVNITLGAIETTYICPLTSDTANAVKNVTVNIHYTDTYKAAYDYRFHFNEDSYGAGGTVNRFYHKDAAGSSVGDFSLGQAKAADAEHEININVNMYYATEMQGEKVITGYTGKHDRYAEVAHQTGEILPFPEWCVKYGVNGDGKHDYVNDVCSFCDLKKCTGSDHYLIWDAETGSATCIADCKETIKISEYSAIYVSDTGRAGATGLSKDDPLSSFTMAMDLAAKAGKDFTVYLVGTVTPMARQIDKTYNTFTNSFEESEHTNTITITSVSTSSKGTLHFTNACRRYFMYGPTTFKNIKISCDVTNGIYLFARGHKLVMDTGIVMVDVKGKTTSEKTDADIAGLGATVETSDVKMYLYGGFYAETATDDAGVEYVAKQGLYPGADPEKYDADITVKSGTYWTICGLNRGFLNTHTMDDTTVKMELQNVTAYVVCPTSTDPAAFKNVDAEVHYKGKVNTAFTYRFSYSSNSASADGGTNTVDHFFYKGYNGSAVGDFGVGAKLVKANVNMYYATALKDNAVILGYQIKDERYAAAYQQTTEILPFPEWCIKYAGGHDLGNDDICDFCEITVCTTHPDSEWIVTAEATCSAVGHEVRRCITCLTVLEERDTAIVADAHAAEWDYTDPAKAVYKCTLCQKVLAEKTYADYTAATALYVSSNAAAGGTGLASDSPINDFATAMELAAKSANDVTIYILDIAVLADNGPVSDYNDYVEPTHSNNITITSVSGVNGVLRFSNANAGSLMTMIYHLSGPGYTKFENIEISSWSAVARMNIAARHNKLIFGEGVTADWHRGDNSSRASSDLIVIGGCYGVNSCGTTCNGDCSTLGTDMELYSGNLGAIVGGGYLSGNCCKTGTIKLTLGDISVRRDITAGNYGSDAQSGATGNIVITIDGNISVGESFMFGPMGKYYVRDSEGKKTQDSEGNDITARYTAQDVTIVIKDGSLINGSFQAINSAMPVHTLGQSAADETVFDRVNTVTVYTDPNCPKAMTVYEHVRDALESVDPSLATDASGNLRYSFKWLEAYCKTNNGQHTNNGTGVAADKNIPATCLSDGLQAYQCLDCGKTYYESIPALGHKFTDASGNPIPKTSMAATCIAPEMTKQECQTCRASIYEVVGSSLPLDGTLYTHHSDPEKTGTCQLCGKDLTAICAARPGGHSFGVSTPITSGCATGTRRVCGDCGYVDVTLTSIGDGHNYGKYTVTKEPTATEAGIKTRTCKGCGKVDTALINASGDAINAGALATDASGNLVGFDIESSKLSRVEKAALNALLQENAYGSEVKVSYETDGESVTGITYNIPVPAEYTTYKNVMVVVKDEDGNLHFVDFAVEKGYIVFKF